MILKYCFNDDDWEYEPDDKDLKECLIDILCDECKSMVGENFDAVGAKQMAEFVVNDCDVFFELCETFEDFIQEYFENEAFDDYKDALAFQKDEDDWFGTKKDILGR